MEKSVLKTAIQAAFDDVPYPGDDNIGISGGHDDADRVNGVVSQRGLALIDA